MASTKSKQDALIDELLQDCPDPKDILGKNGLLKQLTKRLVERTLKAELTDHLGYEPHASEGHGSGNNRNGKGQKTVQSESGPLQIEVPRDRNGTFEPQFIKKRQRRLEGFDDKVLALYARGLSTRDIQGQFEEIYGVEVSPTLISNVTDAVMDDVRAWQSRPVSAVYPILYFDALFVKTRQAGPVMTKAIYLALGINLEGEKELLGLWVALTEGAKFWLTVFFDYSPEIRRVIYTTNAIESLNYSLRKLLKTRGAFPNDDSTVKILYLAINRVAKKWTMPIRDWKAALNQFVILFGDRVPV